jgi:choline dehydrogenase-like flavoprotein
LVEAGFRTVILESGGSLADWLFNPKLKRLAEYEFTGDTAYPLTRTSSRAVGGNSHFWTGRSDRFHPSDFEGHPYTPPENPWPIRYRDLAPYYDEAEHTLRVRGGPLSEHMPPRDGPLPLPPSPRIDALKALMRPAGVEVDDSPTATPRKGIRFFRVNKEILPRFLRSPHGTLVSGVTVTRLLHDARARVVGARCRTLDGAEKTVRADIFVVACGGIQTPRLLLLSRSAVFPDGIGNRHDRVGRGFNEHPAPNIYARIPHNRHTILPTHKIGRTHQFYEAFRPEGLGAVVPVVIQSVAFPHHLVRYRLRDMPRHAARILSRTVRASLYMGCICEQRPGDGNRVTLSAHRRDAFGDPIAHLLFSYHPDDLRLIERSRQLLHGPFDRVGATDREEIEVTWSRHHQGTCRMGVDPRASVCDPDLRVHGVPNLYLAGCETFVTGSAVPPTLTIVALAHRLADHLVARPAGRGRPFRPGARSVSRASAGQACLKLSGRRE